MQATWLRLLENIHRIEYPERIGSWLATTARHECLRHVTAGKRVMLVQDHDAFSGSSGQQPAIDERLLADERAQAVRAALSQLPSRSQRLLELLMADPPVPYVEISDRARPAHRQHRAHPQPLPGTTPRHAPDDLSLPPEHHVKSQANPRRPSLRRSPRSPGKRR